MFGHCFIYLAAREEVFERDGLRTVRFAESLLALIFVVFEHIRPEVEIHLVHQRFCIDDVVLGLCEEVSQLLVLAMGEGEHLLVDGFEDWSLVFIVAQM